jgi:hypothetical protein
MPLPWPGISSTGGDIPGEKQQAITRLLDEFADVLAPLIMKAGFQLHASPLWRPWNLIVVQDSEKVLAAFSPLQGGISMIRWVDQSAITMPPASLVASVASELGMPVAALITLPLPGTPMSSASILAAAIQHVTEVERANRLGRLGDLTGLSHLEPSLRQFLDDHPNPDRNVFVMMRFMQTDQMGEIYSAIRDTSASYGFHVVRADDRDYTGELWSNIEVYMTCCHYGVAVFEDIDRRDFNPNVSLELGYMLGRRKRTLILREKRLPDLPADVVHRLYKPFDMFAISESVSREVRRWIEVDLGVPRIVPFS